MKNRQWVLAKRPANHVALEHFDYREIVEDAHLEDDQVLIRNRVFFIAPTMRNSLNEPEKAYNVSVNIDEPVIGPAAFEVIKSNNPRWPEGTKLLGISRWQDYVVFEPDPAKATLISIPPEMGFTEAAGIYGLNSLTAYVGLINIGAPRPGETLVVSGAAGSVGTVAAQIGKIMGCHVIGVAGGREKCDWLINECGIDHAIDYKIEDVGERLAELCPGGVDIFFDNVGGAIMQAVIDNIARYGRIAVCGQISSYDSDKPAPGPRDMMRIVYWSVKIQGFLFGDFRDQAPVAQQKLMQWVSEGRIKHREDIRQGFETLPQAFLDIFKGQNRGSLLVEV